MFQFQGFIDQIGEINQVSEKFTKREVWVSTDGEYPQTINFQFSQDRCDLLEPFSVGDEVLINFNLRGRKWENAEGVVKCFNSLDAWKIEAVGMPQQQAAQAPIPPAIQEGEDDDDLPF